MIEPNKEIWIEMIPLEWPPESKHVAARVWTHRLISGLNILRSISETNDGRKWLHVSVSRPDRMPEWMEIKKVKENFIGKDREAIQMFPKEKDYVNVHKYCLHLWSPLEDFSQLPNLQNLIVESAI